MNGIDAQTIRAALACDRPGCDCHRANGNVHSPTHDDRNPSLSVTEKNGKILVYDHAGFSQDEVIEALRGRGLWPPVADTIRQNGHGQPKRMHAPLGPAPGRRGECRTHYDYRASGGALRYQAIRIDAPGQKKRFQLRRPDGNGGWIYNADGVERLPYRLPEMLAASHDEWLFITEGEKAADRIWAAGWQATTNSEGAEKWQPELAQYFPGRLAAILVDNDIPGFRHGLSVHRNIDGIASAVAVLRFTLVPAKGDVVEYLDAGGTMNDIVAVLSGEQRPGLELIDVDELERLAGQNASSEPENDAPQRVRFLTAREFAQQTSAQTEWIVHGYVPVGGVLKIDAPPKRGKTTLITRMVEAVLNGSDFLGKPTAKGPVILLSEQGGTSFREALARAGLLDRDDLHLAIYRDIAGLPWSDVVAQTFELAVKIGAVLIVVDTFPQVSKVRGDDENSSGHALAALEPIQIGADVHGIGVIVSFHDRKGGGEVGESGRGSSAYAGAVDVIVHLNRAGGNFKPTVRKIEALSRFDATPAELFIELTANGFVSLGSEDDVVTVMIANALADVLPATEDAAKPVGQIKHKEKDENGEPAERIEPGILDDLAGCGVKAARSTVDAELVHWREAGYVARTGEGKRGNPHRFWLLAKPPESFFRSPSSGASEERNAAEATGDDDRTDRHGNVSSDAHPPSEESKPTDSFVSDRTTGPLSESNDDFDEELF